MRTVLYGELSISVGCCHSRPSVALTAHGRKASSANAAPKWFQRPLSKVQRSSIAAGRSLPLGCPVLDAGPFGYLDQDRNVARMGVAP